MTNKTLDTYNAKLQQMSAAPIGSVLRKKLQSELVKEAAAMAESVTGKKEESKSKLPQLGSRKTGLTFGKATLAMIEAKGLRK